MPINVNLSPDRGAAAQTLMNRNDGDILRNVATQAFPGRINANTEYYGHEDKQQLQINGGQRLDIIFNYLLTNGEVKNPDAGNNKEMKIYVKLQNSPVAAAATATFISLLSSSSDSGLEIDEGMKKRKKKRKTNKRKTKRRKTTKRRKSTKRKTKRRKNKRSRRK